MARIPDLMTDWLWVDDTPEGYVRRELADGTEYFRAPILGRNVIALVAPIDENIAWGSSS